MTRRGWCLHGLVSLFAAACGGASTRSTPIAEFPRPEALAAIGVTHHKPKGAAWAQLVILVVFEDTGSLVRT